MSNNNEVLLRVEHLKQYFKMGTVELKAVDDVSFDIKKGEVFGLVGESGCGKTTTGRSIIKLYDITGGNIFFKGQRIGAGKRDYKDAAKAAAEKGDRKEVQRLTKLMAEAEYDYKNCDKIYRQNLSDEWNREYAEKVLAADKAGDTNRSEELKKELKNKLSNLKTEHIMTKIQMIFQDPIASLNPRMTVREIISEGLTIRGIKDKKYIDQRVYDVLEMVGLVREHADRYPHEFSGGQRQRIGIARAIVLEPELIIADEPISALDVSIQAQVINLLNELRERMGLTIMFIAHDLSVVKYFSDRIAVMYYGKIVELASSDELFEHPLHPYTRSLLSAIPLPDPHYEKQRKRIIYNPVLEHDYSTDKPELREVLPGHFVNCNDAEFAKLKQQLGL